MNLHHPDPTPKPRILNAIERAGSAGEDFANVEERRAQAIEKKLAWPEAVEILSDLEGDILEVYRQVARGCTLPGDIDWQLARAAKKAVAAWQEKRARQL
jgi:hypothetical protein